VLQSALPFAVVGVSAVVLSRFDVIVLGLTGTDAEVGGYEPIVRIVEQVMLIVPLLFIAQYLPVATRAYANSATETFRELYLGLSKLAYVLAFPGVVILAAFPDTVVQTLYGAEFPSDPLVVRLLLVGFVVNLCFGLNGAALASVGSRAPLARSGLITITAMVVLGLLLVPPFGAEGAAIATSAAYVAMNVAVAAELYRLQGVAPLRGDYAATLLSSVAPLAVAIWIGADGILGAITVSAGVSVAWVAALVGTRVIRVEELRRITPRSRR
jgi:O-antigen/teichoic acid export membrane protein